MALVEGEGDETLGHLDLTLDGEIARIGRVCIDPMRRGQGLAHVLNQFALDRARSLGASEAHLTVIVGNDAAIRTYERAGFTTSSRSDRPDVRVMSRTLKRLGMSQPESSAAPQTLSSALVVCGRSQMLDTRRQS